MEKSKYNISMPLNEFIDLTEPKPEYGKGLGKIGVGLFILAVILIAIFKF